MQPGMEGGDYSAGSFFNSARILFATVRMGDLKAPVAFFSQASHCANNSLFLQTKCSLQQHAGAFRPLYCRSASADVGRQQASTLHRSALEACDHRPCSCMGAGVTAKPSMQAVGRQLGAELA